MDRPKLILSKRSQRLLTLRRWIGGWVLARIANLVLSAVLAIFVFIAWKSIPFFTQESILRSLSSSQWHPERAEPEFGMLAMIYGSCIITLGAMLLAVPIGITTAIVLSDMVPFRVRQWIKPIMELLAAIPSVAFGFFAIKVVAPFLQDTFGIPSGTNALNASLILAIMAVPTIISVAEDALTSLGRDLREASYSLGATRFETLWKVVLPAAHAGIIAAVVLGMMRAIGETMVVWMAAGNASNIPVPWCDPAAVFGTFFEAVRTMTATVAADMGETSADSMHRNALFAVGFVLLVFTFILNLFTEYVSNRFRAVKRDGDLRFGFVFLPLRKLSAWKDHAVHGLLRRIGPKNHLRMRIAGDGMFTGFGFLSVALLGAVLLLVLGPLLGNAREAFLFQATVEHRLYLDGEAASAEYEKCLEARRSVYETLERFAWLDPEPLIERAARNDRATRSESERILAELRHDLEVTPSEDAKPILEQKLEEAEAERKKIDRASKKLLRDFKQLAFDPAGNDFTVSDYDLEGTPSQDTIELAIKYIESVEDVNVDLRETPTTADPNKTYSEAFRELRDRILGTDGNGALLGPENREGISHLPPELRFGASHWSIAKKYCAEIRHATIWRPQFDSQGNILQNIEVSIDRNELFDAPSMQGIREMLDYIDAELPAMMNPRWTFYGEYFFTKATPGHFLGGIGPELLGTLLVTFLSILFALPVGVATAAYLVETSNDGTVSKAIRLAINTLAGVPSIVFGLFGLAVIVQYLTGKPCILAGSLTLALLILPVVIRASEEAIRSVPQTFREAALGLGASPGRCFFTVTLPAALPGILTGTILAMSRAAGETAPLLFTCAVASGGISSLKNALMEPTPVLSYSAYDIAVGDRIAEMVPYNQYGLVAALILLVLFLNLAAIIIRGRIAKKLRGV